MWFILDEYGDHRSLILLMFFIRQTGLFGRLILKKTSTKVILYEDQNNRATVCIVLFKITFE